MSVSIEDIKELLNAGANPNDVIVSLLFLMAFLFYFCFLPPSFC